MSKYLCCFSLEHHKVSDVFLFQFSLMVSFPGIPFGIFMFSICAVVIGLIQVQLPFILIFEILLFVLPTYLPTYL